MNRLNSEILPQVLEACRAGAREAAGALSRALGRECSLTVGEAGKFDPAAAPAGFDGPGLALLWKFGDAAMAVVLPAATELLPTWCAAPDATGESRLATLAQELSVLFLPETLGADEVAGRHVNNIAATLKRGALAADATLVAIEINSVGLTGRLSLIWPLPAAAELFAPPAPVQPPAPSPKPTAAPAAAPRDLSTLPGYSRSLLKIRVPVSVQLAAKKELVQEVISLAPGSIIKFEKGCDQLLQMIVGEHAVAEGEAVKIGEKFGFRVSSMLMPPEHFVAVKRPRRA